MAKHYSEQVYNMVEAWFFSGPRTSEMFGQRWPNVDLFSAKLAVVEAVVRGEQKDSTKTNVARDVLLNSRALAAINRQAKHTRMAGGTPVARPQVRHALDGRTCLLTQLLDAVPETLGHPLP
ncbi:MAG: hypothetical protein VB131_05945, partial [Burkholderia gladioli]